MVTPFVDPPHHIFVSISPLESVLFFSEWQWPAGHFGPSRIRGCELLRKRPSCSLTTPNLMTYVKWVPYKCVCLFCPWLAWSPRPGIPRTIIETVLFGTSLLGSQWKEGGWIALAADPPARCREQVWVGGRCSLLTIYPKRALTNSPFAFIFISLSVGCNVGGGVWDGRRM